MAFLFMSVSQLHIFQPQTDAQVLLQKCRHTYDGKGAPRVSIAVEGVNRVGPIGYLEHLEGL